MCGEHLEESNGTGDACLCDSRERARTGADGKCRRWCRIVRKDEDDWITLTVQIQRWENAEEGGRIGQGNTYMVGGTRSGRAETAK